LAAAVISFALSRLDPGATLAPFYPAVVIAFVVAGAGPGVLASLASAAIGAAVLGAGRDAVVPVGLFLRSAGLIGWVICRLRGARAAMARESNERGESLSLAIESAHLGVWRFDPAIRTFFVSAIFETHFGFPPDVGPLAYDALFDQVHPEDRAATKAAFEKSLTERGDFSVEHRVIWPDGSEHWIHGCGRPLFGRDGRLVRVDGVAIDITGHKRAEQNYSTSMATIRAAFQSANEAIIICDTKGNVIDCNEAVRLFCRIGKDERTPATYSEFVALLDMLSLDGRPVTEDQNPYFLALKGRQQTLELRFRRKDTGEEWYGVVGFGSIYGAKGEIIGAVVTGFDITELKELQGHLEELVQKRTRELAAANQALVEVSRHDALTGLFNRLAANERLHSEYRRMQRTGEAYGVLMVDIDLFKNVNDSCGHRVGDEVLALVAQTLADNLRAYDFISRWGGEEFLVLLPATSLETARRVAEKLRAAIEAAPHPLAKRITISVGAAVASRDDIDEDIAVMKADQRLYEAKNNGRNRVEAGLVQPA
jgi:diguanylate cyclase (GGDEF)-like protein/PAS domain S-box-containing protein